MPACALVANVSSPGPWRALMYKARSRPWPSRRIIKRKHATAVLARVEANHRNWYSNCACVRNQRGSTRPGPHVVLFHSLEVLVLAHAERCSLMLTCCILLLFVGNHELCAVVNVPTKALLVVTCLCVVLAYVSIRTFWSSRHSACRMSNCQLQSRQVGILSVAILRTYPDMPKYYSIFRLTGHIWCAESAPAIVYVSRGLMAW